MKKEKTKKINAAAEAFSDFNIFGAIKVMLEGGTLYTSDGQDMARSIIENCDEAMALLLPEYDRLCSDARGES